MRLNFYLRISVNGAKRNTVDFIMMHTAQGRTAG